VAERRKQDRELKYTGLPEFWPRPDEAPGRYPYLPEPGLVEAVNLAICLGRPLLLVGPLGSGKSGLAPALAHELGLKCFTWHIKSTSKAREGLYRYDSVARLRDAHLPTDAGALSLDDDLYIRYGPLGEAIRSPEPSIVFIHEIDNADIDFPNDLLIELDERRFFIPELKRWEEACSTPIVIITSSLAKALPEAFLRRCVYCHLEFPDTGRLVKIMAQRYPDIDPIAVETGLFGNTFGDSQS